MFDDITRWERYLLIFVLLFVVAQPVVTAYVIVSIVASSRTPPCQCGAPPQAPVIPAATDEPVTPLGSTGSK